MASTAFPTEPATEGSVDSRSFWEVAESRTSCREFSTDPVSTEQITTILKAAKSAPSAGNLQAWRVFVIEGKKLLRKLAQAACNQDWITSSSVVLVFCAETQLSSTKYGKRGKRLFSIQDATVACSYAQLAAEALGLGACWVGAFDEEAVKGVLEANKWPQFRPVSLLVLGNRSLKKRRRSSRLALSDLVKTSDWQHETAACL